MTREGTAGGNRMAWPEPTAYNEAIQSPGVCFADDELRRGQPVTNALGLPIPCAGNFALVYQINGAGQSWAVKCFTREAPARQQRYQAISEHLYAAALPFTVDFHYLEQGIRVGGQWYPVVKMRWVEGLTLNALLGEHVDRPQVLQRLTQMWLPLAQKLRRASLAHADLQHGNVLLVPGQKTATLDLRLIDYDGMFVPALAGVPSGEVGHPNYQHPQRLRSGAYDAESDRFAHLVIYTALRCLLAGGRPLWEKHDNAENLLFREQDFKDPASSALLEELWRIEDPDARALVGHLLLASQAPLDQVPLLDDLIDGGSVLPLTPRQQKRVRELLPAGTQAGPIPVEPAPSPVAPGGRAVDGDGEAARPQAAAVAAAPADKADPYTLIPLAPPAPGTAEVRRTELKAAEPTRPPAANRKRLTQVKTSSRGLLVGALAGGGLAACALVVVLVLALSGSGGSTPPQGPAPWEPPPLPPAARSLTLQPVAPVALKGGERRPVTVRLAAGGQDGPISLAVEDLPERVRQVQPVSVAPGQNEAVIELHADLGAAEAVRQARVVARGQGLEAAQPLDITVGKQTVVSWLPVPAVTLKPGEGKAVPLRVLSRGHDAPLELVLEGLPAKVQLKGNLAPLAPGQTEATAILVAAPDAPRGVHQARVWIQANGVKLVPQTLEIHVEPAAASLALLPILPMTLNAQAMGQRLFVTVQRQGCEGPVTVEAAPTAGVKAQSVTIPAGGTTGTMMLTLAGYAPAQVDLQLTARLGDLKATQSVRLTVQGVVARAPRLRSRPVSFPTVDGVTLRGTFYPSGNGRNAPCVLLLHELGATSQLPEWENLAGTLQQAGFAVLSFDFRGHGQSTAINPKPFWGQPFNKYATRVTNAKKMKQLQTIHWKDFYKTYYPALANDIAAARTFLDQRALFGECSAGNLTLIGAREGATLGALWLNAECHRHRVTSPAVRPGLQLVLDPVPQGKDVAAVVWVSIEPQLGTAKTSISGMLDVPVRRCGVAVAFVHAAGDAQATNIVAQCKALLKQKGLNGARAVAGATRASGVALLAQAPDTTGWVVGYLNQVQERHRGDRVRVREEGQNFVWRIPRSVSNYAARTPADHMVRFDDFKYFLR
jgi:pimeloyl-ACP methyl ester carboxylesterase